MDDASIKIIFRPKQLGDVPSFLGPEPGSRRVLLRLVCQLYPRRPCPHPVPMPPPRISHRSPLATLLSFPSYPIQRVQQSDHDLKYLSDAGRGRDYEGEPQLRSSSTRKVKAQV